MNNRSILAVVVATVVTTSSGCAPFKNFFFGRGAKCGLCTRLSSVLHPNRAQAPLCGQPQYAQPQYTQPQYTQPQCAQPQLVQPQYAQPSVGCGCGSGLAAGDYGPAVGYGQTVAGYGGDPNCCAVGNGVDYGVSVDGYNGAWQPRSIANPGYQSNYYGYPDYGYKVDKNGDRIIYEEPLPAGARAVN